MKRLLAYLFIVLGLGLVFSVNSWAPIRLVQVKQVKFCQYTKGNWDVEINLEMYRERLPNKTVDASIGPWVGGKLNEIFGILRIHYRLRSSCNFKFIQAP
mgnify:CR=1 FL=1